MIVVIIIIGALAGLLLPALRRAQIETRKGVIRADIKNLGLALKQYEFDFCVYPPDDYSSVSGYEALDEGSECLVFFLGSRFTVNGNVYGPYMEFKRDQLGVTGDSVTAPDEPLSSVESIGGTTSTIPVYKYKDFFGNPYTYNSSAPQYNFASIDIYSFGPDGKNDGGLCDLKPSGDGTLNDDINNW